MFNYSQLNNLENELEAVKALKVFTKDIRYFWDLMITRVTSLPDELMTTVKQAWEDIKNRLEAPNDPESLLGRLDFLGATSDSNLKAQLNQCGLIGNELKAKLSVIQHYFEEQLFGEDDSNLKKLTSVCLTLLGSLLTAIGLKDKLMEAIQEGFELINTIFLG